jgi:DNA-binding PadR family transcriptional regulator
MDQSEVRLSERGLRVLRLLLESPRQARSGAEIGRATKTGSGTLYPMLARWEAAGWLTSDWEAVDPHEVGRPRRRLYRLTGEGQRNALAVLVDLQLPSGDVAWAR